MSCVETFGEGEIIVCQFNFGFGAEIVILRDNRLASITALCVLTAYLSTGAIQSHDVLHSPAL